MAKKFFTLIHGGDLHIAPETKRIPAKDFSTMVSAKDLLQKVKDDAEQYRKEVSAECEELKEKAQKEGFEAGFSQWAEKLAELEHEIHHVRAEVEKMVIPVALKAAKKIVSSELTVSKKAVISIISNSLKSVAQHKKIVIFVNRDDLPTIEKHKGELAKTFETLESFSIVEREDIAPGGCVIETEGGIINAQLENQWLLLENAFERLRRAPVTTESQKEDA